MIILSKTTGMEIPLVIKTRELKTIILLTATVTLVEKARTLCINVRWSVSVENKANYFKSPSEIMRRHIHTENTPKSKPLCDIQNHHVVTGADINHAFVNL